MFCSATLLLAVWHVRNISHWWAWIILVLADWLFFFSLPLLTSYVIQSRGRKLKTMSWKHAQSWNYRKVCSSASSLVFYSPCKAESSRAAHPSDGLLEPPTPFTSPGLPCSWPVTCSGKPANKDCCHFSLRGTELICHSGDSCVNVFLSFWCSMELLGSTLI